MKSAVYAVLFGFLSFSTSAVGQSAEVGAVERVYGAQLGYLGAWGYAELPLGRSVVARLEAGLDAGYRGGSFFKENIVVGALVISAGPRWYYNLDKRVAKEKRTAGNAVNFLSLPITYHPG